jgi:hypothetical protein
MVRREQDKQAAVAAFERSGAVHEALIPSVRSRLVATAAFDRIRAVSAASASASGGVSR